MGIFEMHNIVNVAIIAQIKVLLNSFVLFNKVIAYVKDEGSNLATLTIILTSMVSCFPLHGDSMDRWLVWIITFVFFLN
jgi:hypothetical protein